MLTDADRVLFTRANIEGFLFRYKDLLASIDKKIKIIKMEARNRGKKRSITGEEEKISNSLGWSSNGGVRDSPRNKAPPGKKVKAGSKTDR